MKKVFGLLFVLMMTLASCQSQAPDADTQVPGIQVAPPLASSQPTTAPTVAPSTDPTPQPNTPSPDPTPTPVVDNVSYRDVGSNRLGVNIPKVSNGAYIAIEASGSISYFQIDGVIDGGQPKLVARINKTNGSQNFIFKADNLPEKTLTDSSCDHRGCVVFLDNFSTAYLVANGNRIDMTAHFGVQYRTEVQKLSGFGLNSLGLPAKIDVTGANSTASGSTKW